MSKRRPDPLASRIKKMMQKDDDVGRINAATPSTIGRAVELFLQQLCDKSLEVATERKSKTITPSHLKAFVMRESTMDFLKDVVAGAPDLAAADEAEAPEAKKRRTSAKGSAADQDLSPRDSGHAAALPAADSLTAGLDTKPPTPSDISRNASAVPGSMATAGSSQAALLSSPKSEPASAAPPKRTRVSAKAKAAAAAAAGGDGDDNDDYEPGGQESGTRGRGRRGPGRGRGRGRGGATKGDPTSEPVPAFMSTPEGAESEQPQASSPQALAKLPTVPLVHSPSEPTIASQAVTQQHIASATAFAPPLPDSNSLQATPPESTTLAGTPSTLTSLPAAAPSHLSPAGPSQAVLHPGGNSSSGLLPAGLTTGVTGEQLQQQAAVVDVSEKVEAAQLLTLPAVGGVSLSHFNAPMVADEDDDYDC